MMSEGNMYGEHFFQNFKWLNFLHIAMKIKIINNKYISTIKGESNRYFKITLMHTWKKEKNIYI